MDPREAVDRSCRGPVLFLAFSAVAWLLVYSLFALLAGVKVHASGMMADSAWLAYGRIQPASQLALQFGFLVQLGLAVSAWILSHRGKTVLVDGGYLIFGGMLWNAGVTLGFLGILAGNASGLEGLQMPGKVLPLLFFGFVLVGLSLVQTNNRRTDEEMSPAQWFLFAATLWLPWVLGGSYLLIHFFHAKGVVANIVDWWFIQNFAKVYLTFVGLGTLFHFLSALSGRQLVGRGHAQLAFWLLLLFGSVGGVSPGAPVPAWLPALSTVTAVFYFFGVIAAWVSLTRTISGASAADDADSLAYNLMRLAALVFISISVVNVFFAFPRAGEHGGVHDIRPRDGVAFQPRLRGTDTDRRASPYFPAPGRDGLLSKNDGDSNRGHRLRFVWGHVADCPGWADVRRRGAGLRVLFRQPGRRVPFRGKLDFVPELPGSHPVRDEKL